MARLGRIAQRASRHTLAGVFVAATFSFPLETLAQEVGDVAGTVTDSAGIPIYGAEVTVDGVPFRAFSDEKGLFRLGTIPTGVRRVSARRLGFSPAAVDVHVSLTATAVVSLRLRTLAAMLPPVVVRPSRMRYTGRLAGYYERLEKNSSGVFVTRSQIDRENPSTLGQLLLHVPGIRGVRGRAGIGIRMRGRNCAPLVWIDGTPMPAGEVDLDAFTPSTIHGIELYLGSTTAPMRFTYNRGLSSCGTVLIWSRGPDTDPIVRIPTPSVSLADLVNGLAVFDAHQVDKPVALDTTRILSLQFPAALFAARVPGLVIAEFVVDTAGRVEEGTLGIVSSTAPLFTDAVRVALETASFVPAVKGGQLVRQLVQQPFKFAVDGSGNRHSAPKTGSSQAH